MRLYFLISAAASVSVGVALTLAASAPTLAFGVVTAMLAAATVGTLVWEARVRGDAFSILSLHAIFYLLAFGAGGIYYWIWPGTLRHTFDHSNLVWSVTLATIAWLAYVAGYATNPLRPIRPRVPRFPTLARGHSLWALAPLLVIGWAARAELVAGGRYFHARVGGPAESTGSSWLISVFALLPFVVAAYVGAVGRPDGRLLHPRMFWALISVEVAWSIPTGARGELLGIALAVAGVHYYRCGRVPRRGLVLTAVACVFVLFPLAMNYRSDGSNYQAHPRAALLQAATATFSTTPGRGLHAGLDATFSRFSDVTSLAVIAKYGRRPLGTSPTDSFRWAAEAFVPRAFYPSKADPGLSGLRFGSAYGLTDREHPNASIAITQPGELYLSFGMLGVLLGMPLVGALGRLLNDYFASRRSDPSVAAIYMVAAWLVVNGQENIFALGFVSVVKTMLVLAFLFGLLDRMRKVALSERIVAKAEA
jgi:hypothetical protein